MFYCDNCAEKNGWPETFTKSRGVCEMCEEYHICNDRPSHLLINRNIDKDKNGTQLA